MIVNDINNGSMAVYDMILVEINGRFKQLNDISFHYANESGNSNRGRFYSKICPFSDEWLALLAAY